METTRHKKKLAASTPRVALPGGRDVEAAAGEPYRDAADADKVRGAAAPFAGGVPPPPLVQQNQIFVSDRGGGVVKQARSQRVAKY